jgi:hypothetical protein
MERDLERARALASRAMLVAIVGLVLGGILLGPAAIAWGRTATATFQRLGRPTPVRARLGIWLGIAVTLLWTILVGVRLSGIVR